MTELEKATRFAKSAPPLRKTDQDALNALFKAYIFRRSCTGEVWTTCCHRHEVVTTGEILYADHQREPLNSYMDPPAPHTRCPFCGRPVIIKELRYTGKRDNLASWRRAVILRWYRGALWATGYECVKRYGSEYALTAYPSCKLLGAYRFRPGLAQGTRRHWWDDDPFASVQVQDSPLHNGRWNVREPFGYCWEYGMGYDIIGLEEIQKSPFRYCGAETYFDRHHTGLVEFLEACCFYPRQIEMLMKAGMRDVVFDLAERGVKHAVAIDWNQEKPTDSFGLSKQELNAFLATGRRVETLELYKRLKRRVPMGEVAGWIDGGLDVGETISQAKKWNIPPEKLARYIKGKAEGAQFRGKGGMIAALEYWKDYVDAAEAVGGYPLHRENVLLPRALVKAHDEATRRHAEVLRRQHEEKYRKQIDNSEIANSLVRASYEERRNVLEKKYAFSLGGYAIRVPAGEEEILDEGRKLHHCVGGYAKRHVKGATTILFLRKETHPDEPLATIEMRGHEIAQIHGYKNDVGKRDSKRPMALYRSFLDSWLGWLENGSKRDKDGAPILPTEKVRQSA